MRLGTERGSLASRWTAALLLLGAATTLAPAVAAAPIATPLHVYLVSSRPADGDTLTAPPPEIRLVFSERVDATLAELVLRGVDTETTLTPRADPEDPRAVLASAPRVPAGAYRIAWRIISPDGHPVSGQIRFLIQPEEVPPDTSPEEPPPPEEPELHPDEAVPVLAAGLRGVAVGLLLALGGLLFFQAWIASSPSPRVRRLVGILAVAAPLALAAHLAAWLLHLVPAGGGFDPAWIAAGLSTPTGRWEMVRTGAAFFALWAATGKARRPALAAALVLAAILASGSIGHPVASETWWMVPAKSLHLVAISLWLGGLLWIVVSRTDRPEFAGDVGRVSTTALVAVLFVALTGAAQSYDLLEGPASYFNTGYGRLVLAKVGGLILLVLFGARNRFRLIPALKEEGGPRSLRRSVRWETGVMVVVLLLAGLLAYVPPPGV